MITILLPSHDYDPTESGVIWQALVDNGFSVQFATPEGKVAHADVRLTKTGFGLLTPILMTQTPALTHYNNMASSTAFNTPIRYDDIDIEKSFALFVPGGHAPGMKSLLESNIAQEKIVAAFRKDMPVAAVCHGVLLLARSIDPNNGHSVLYGRKTTSLVKSMELSAWVMTWLWLKNYYRTYDISVETEVKQALASNSDFCSGPLLPIKDKQENVKKGFTVIDGNYISARWPGDCYRLAKEFVELLQKQN